MERQYTDVVIVHEDNKKPSERAKHVGDCKRARASSDGLLICHLPEGPTAYFKINTLKFTKNIKDAGESTEHCPEVILNNFNTRLGHTVARMFACLFPHDPEFHGRRAITFHNQRDYIFFRHHRFVAANFSERFAPTRSQRLGTSSKKRAKKRRFSSSGRDSRFASSGCRREPSIRATASSNGCLRQVFGLVSCVRANAAF